MPKNKVSDPITDQEIAFARLVLSGAMTDRQAAGAVGLNPDSAAYTKSKPRVRDFMLEHRAAVQQQLVQQEAEELRRVNLAREQVLARLWEIAHLGPEKTRGSVTAQVKCLSMIIAMENFIPDRRTVASQQKSAPAPFPHSGAAAYLSRQHAAEHAVERAPQQATPIDSQPAPAREEDQQEDSPGTPWSVPELAFAPGPAAEAPPDLDPSQSTFANRVNPTEAPPLAPDVPVFGSVPDTRMGFSIKKNRFAHHPR